MNRLRAVVFDLDGTLCDSVPDIAVALNATLNAEGLPSFDLAAVKNMVGGGAETLIARALQRHGETPQPPRIHALLGDFLARYRQSPCKHTCLYPGARETLAALHGAGWKLGICTNKPSDLTGLVLDALRIRPHFGSVVAASPALTPKPAPDMLLAALGELGVGPQAAIMVGDSIADLGVARAAGVECILLEHGYSAVSVRSLGADLVCAGFSDLLAALSEPGA